MEASVYILIVSLIVRYGHGGLTEVTRQPSYDACIKRERLIASRFESHRVAHLSSRCAGAAAGPPVYHEAEPTAEDQPKLEIAPKPAPVVGLVAKPKNPVQTLASESKGKCLHRKYRIINHRRVWYCKRRA